MTSHVLTPFRALLRAWRTRAYWREINRGRALMLLDCDVHGALDCYNRAERMKR